MENPTMLYKYPGNTSLHGDNFDTLIVDEKDVSTALRQGWSLTTPEAIKKHQAALKKKEQEEVKDVDETANPE